MPYVGIDLGTTNSAVAYLRNTPEVIENQGRPTTPSVVAFDGAEVLVGQAAKDQSMVLPAVVSVKRHMGTDKRFTMEGREYTPEEISSLILKELKRGAEERLGEVVDGAVITIPAYFETAAKDATKRAGEMAGLKDVRLLAEPIAAALAYGAEDLVLVYDLGGGTFDVAIIDCSDFKMLGLDGDNYLGGDDFDARLVAHLGKEVKAKFGVDIEATPESKQLAKSECERAKIDLSKREQTKIRYQTVIGGKAINVLMTVTRAEFEALIMDLADRTIEKVNGAIAKAKEKDPNFSKEDIQTVLLVGGSTYVPLIRRKVAEAFGREASSKVNPDLAVALGAAVSTASGPPKGVHRIRLDPLPQVTNKTECQLKGRSTPGAKLTAQCGGQSASTVADARGRFSMTLPLAASTVNEITVTSVDDKGEERKAQASVRHDPAFSGEEKPGYRQAVALGGGLTARTLGIGVSGEDHRLGVIIQSQTQIPASVQNRDYCIGSRGNNMPGICEIEIYEGELPYAPLNTHLANLRLETAASPSTAEPIEITFQITEDHLLTVTARMTNFPDRVVTTKVQIREISNSKKDVVERTVHLLNQYAEKVRPEDKVRLNKAKQALLDLSEQHKRDPQKDRYERIKQTGLQLRSDLDRVEASCAT